MRYAIVGGTGVYNLEGVSTVERTIETRFGEATIYEGLHEYSDIVFLTRHGKDHTIPPHKVNYRANIAALKKIGVERALGLYCVGSLKTLIAPGDFVLLDQFIDQTYNREDTFYSGGAYGLVHTDMVRPFCNSLRNLVLKEAEKQNFRIMPYGNYICFNGPRFETVAEIRYFAQIGGDVIGMTGATETMLFREAGIHYAAAGFSINFGAGLLSEKMEFKRDGLNDNIQKLSKIFISVLRDNFNQECNCNTAQRFNSPPTIDIFA